MAEHYFEALGDAFAAGELGAAVAGVTGLAAGDGCDAGVGVASDVVDCKTE